MSETIVTGLADLQKALDQLPAKLEANVLRSALRQGAKVQLAKAREAVPVQSGDLRESLRISTRSRRGLVRAILKAGNKKAFYAHLVEFGTAEHWIKPKNRKSLFLAGVARETVHHPGAQKKPFIRPALDSTVPAVIAAVGAYLRRRLDKEGIDLPDAENR